MIFRPHTNNRFMGCTRYFRPRDYDSWHTRSTETRVFLRVSLHRQAIVLAVIFELLGAVLLGRHVVTAYRETVADVSAVWIDFRIPFGSILYNLGWKIQPPAGRPCTSEDIARCRCCCTEVYSEMLSLGSRQRQRRWHVAGGRNRAYTLRDERHNR